MAFCLTGFKSDGKCLADQKIVLKNQSEKITDWKATTMETCVCGGGGGVDGSKLFRKFALEHLSISGDAGMWLIINFLHLYFSGSFFS